MDEFTRVARERDEEADRRVSEYLFGREQAVLIDVAKEAINAFAAVYATANPHAGLVVKTVALLNGWIWCRWKLDRARPALQAVAEKLERVKSEYVRRDEFADLLEDALRRLGAQPNDQQRRVLRNILEGSLEGQQSHVENRLFLRLADELSSRALQLLELLGRPATAAEAAAPWEKWFDVLVARSGVSATELNLVVCELQSANLWDPMGVHGRIKESEPLDFYLTPAGRSFRAFCK